MSADNKEAGINSELADSDNDLIIPDVSFLDGLNSKTLEVVELIMTTSTGKKDIIHQLKLSAST